MGFIVLPVRRDATVVREDSYDVLRLAYPGWERQDGDALTIAVDAPAVLYSELATLVTQMGSEGFRWFGRTLVGIPPEDGSPATGMVTFTTVDTDGPYVIDAGTEIAGRAGSGELVTFRTLATLTVPNGSSTGSVDVECVEDGEDFNGVSGTAEMTEYLDFVSGVAFDDPTSGGADREDDDAYLDRLADELKLLSPRPLRADDFAQLAQRYAGVGAIATALDNVHLVTNDVTGTEADDTIAATAHGLSDDDVVHLEGLVGGSGLDDWTDYYVVNATADDFQVSLTLAGAAIDFTTDITDGSVVRVDTDVPGYVTVAIRDAAGDAFSSIVKTSVRSQLEELRAMNYVVPVIDPTDNPIDIAYSAFAKPGWDPADVQDQIDVALANMLGANWGLEGTESSTLRWRNKTILRYREVLKVILALDSVDYLDDGATGLTIAAAGDTPDVVDVTLHGAAPVATVGTITGSVAEAL